MTQNKTTKAKMDSWFKNADFDTLERVTGFNRHDFSPEDGYEEFVETCESYWFNLSSETQKHLYETYS